jgi:hypothetical protein
MSTEKLIRAFMVLELSPSGDVFPSVGTICAMENFSALLPSFVSYRFI